MILGLRGAALTATVAVALGGAPVEGQIGGGVPEWWEHPGEPWDDRYDREHRDRWEEWEEWEDRDDREGRWDRGDRDDRWGRDGRGTRRDGHHYGYGRAGPRRGGPAFCRSGAGHPVHGWRWCVEKGWAGPRVAPPVRRFAPSWRRVPAPRVVFGRFPAPEGRTFGHAGLSGLLGPGVVRRLHHHAFGAPLHGRWYRDRRGAVVVQVRSGPRAVAELSDLDGDRRVDVLLVAVR